MAKFCFLYRQDVNNRWIIPIGIGNQLDQFTLQQLAGQGSQYFQVGQIFDLNNYVEQVAALLCPNVGGFGKNNT